MADKVRFGLRNVHYAVYTEGTGGSAGTYATPVHVPGAVELSISREGSESSFYADDVKYYTMDANAGYSGTLDMALIPDQMLIDLLGFVRDKNGLVVEDAHGLQKEFAMMFEVQGDESPTRYVYYNCKVSRPEFDAETTSDTADPQTQSLDITMITRPFDWGTDKLDAVKSHHTKTGETDSVYNTWFEAVKTPEKATA